MSFYSCGQYVNKTLDLTKHTKMVVPSCGTRAYNAKKAPANVVDGGEILKLVKVELVNGTDKYMKVILTGRPGIQSLFLRMLQSIGSAINPMPMLKTIPVNGLQCFYIIITIQIRWSLIYVWLMTGIFNIYILQMTRCQIHGIPCLCSGKLKLISLHRLMIESF